MAAPILVAYDGSPSSQSAIVRAASVLGPRPALVLFVWDPVMPGPSGDPFGIGGPMIDPLQIQEMDKLVRAQADAVAADGAARAVAAGFSAEALAEETHGSTWSTIVDVAADRGSEAIVIGARGHSGVRSLLLGSVSNAVVHHARVPVLVLPAAEEPAAA
jgi:nucleotide-binding universal stress UspA family protein